MPGSIRILWDSTQAAQVTISGESASWTVNGNPVSFPYTLATSTTFTPSSNGKFSVSVTLYGFEIADSPDGVRTVELQGNNQFVFAPTPDPVPASPAGIGFQSKVTGTVPVVEGIRTASANPFRTWHLALANREDALAKVMYLTHSFGEGQGATDVRRRHLNRVQSLLRKRFPLTVNPDPAGGIGFLPPYYGATSLPNPYSATSGTMTNVTTMGPGGRCIFMPAGAYREFTVSGTSVDVMIAKGSGAGTATTVSIDGVAQTAINGNQATQADGFTTRYSLGSRGTHTVRVTATTGATYFCGITVFDQDESSGIQVFDCAHTGWKASQINAVNSAGGLQNLWNQQPALVLLEYGINEWTTSVPSTTFKSDLLSVIAKVKAGATVQPSIGLIIDYEDLGTYTETWQAFRQVYYDIQAADPTNIALLDMTLRLPKAVSGGAYNQSDGHPNHIGHDFYANAIVDWISPR